MLLLGDRSLRVGDRVLGARERVGSVTHSASATAGDPSATAGATAEIPCVPTATASVRGGVAPGRTVASLG